MIAKRLLQTSLFKTFSSPISRMTFSSDNKWKDRQQSAEKVFINTQQKKTLSKLLHKLEEQQHNLDARQGEFQTKLKEIVNHYKVPNSAAFVAEIINLHRSL